MHQLLNFVMLITTIDDLAKYFHIGHFNTYLYADTIDLYDELGHFVVANDSMYLVKYETMYNHNSTHIRVEFNMVFLKHIIKIKQFPYLATL